MPSSFERRELPDPLPRCEGLASDDTGRFLLLGALPSGEPVRLQLGQVGLRELRRLFVIDPDVAGG